MSKQEISSMSITFFSRSEIALKKYPLKKFFFQALLTKSKLSKSCKNFLATSAHQFQDITEQKINMSSRA